MSKTHSYRMCLFDTEEEGKIMSLNVLVLGTLTSDKQNERFIKNGIRPAPADIVQEYLLKGLSENSIVSNVDMICSPRIRCYPKNKIKRVMKNTFQVNDCNVQSLGFINFPGIGFFQREHNIVAACKKWAKKQ